MNTNSLRVFSGMFNLNITEPEIELVENEVNSGKSGVANLLKKKNKIIYVDHDDKNEIKILDPKGKDISIPSRVLLKTLITLDDIPNEIFVLHSICRYRAGDSSWEFKHTANSLDELKDRIINRFADQYEKVFDDDEDKRQDQLRALYWLFDKEYSKHQYKFRKNFNTIVKVFERNNKRLALILEHREWESNGGFYGRHCKVEESIEFSIKSFTPNDEEYNYVDENREFKSGIWLADELTGKVSEEEVTIIANKLGLSNYGEDKFRLLTAKIYGNIQNELRLELLSAKKKDEDEDARLTIKKKASEMFNKSGKIVRNGITITKEFISYDDLKLSGPNISEFIYHVSLVDSENSDYNGIVKAYIDYVLGRSFIHKAYGGYSNNIEIRFKGTTQLTLGKINIELKAEKKNYYINNFRIRKDELAEVLSNSLMYSELKDYNKFLDEVSSKSFRLIKILESGLSFKIVPKKQEDNDLIRDDSSFFFNFKIKREGNKNYVVINNKTFQIKDFDRLYKLKNQTTEEWRMRIDPIQRLIESLTKSVKDITPKDIGDLILTGKKQFANRIKKSREFIEHAVKITNSVPNKDGWIVKGVSGKEYHVSKDLKVHHWNNKLGNYICIVDDEPSEDEAEKNDCIAKRILALSKDKFVAKEIHTLGLEE